MVNQRLGEPRKKMATTFTIHSFKGGTGKTSLSINTAALLAKSGKNIAIFDFDFSGPSFTTRFNFENHKPKKYINDYIEELATLDEILVDISPQLKTPGKFLVGYANPSTTAIQNIISKGRRWQMKAMERILSAKRELQNAGIDFIAFDTSPGLHYSSLNAIVASDLVFIVVKLDISDFEGTISMLKGIHSALEKKTWLIVNQVPVYNDLEILMNSNHLQDIEEKFKDVIDENFGILGAIPCLCDVGLGKGEIIFALEQPDSPFVKSLEGMLTVLE